MERLGQTRVKRLNERREVFHGRHGTDYDSRCFHTPDYSGPRIIESDSIFLQENKVALEMKVSS